MAHQAHNIPWRVLASNLCWVSDAHHNCENGPTNLVPRMEPDQDKDFTYFVQAFARNIDKHSECERRKYPERYDPPKASDTIINDAIAKKITPTIQRWLNFCKTNDYGCESGLEIECRGDIGDKKPAIPIDERKMSAFLRRYQENDCYQFHDVNGGAFFNLELVKTMVLYGEMDAVLRVCAHPEVDLKSLWSVGECDCGHPEAGWDQLCKLALTAYISLNVIHCLPETWDRASGKTVDTDYRRSYFYQYMLQTCTKSARTSDIIAYPHRHFFGIPDDRRFSPYFLKRAWRTWAKNDPRRFDWRYPLGMITIEEFLTLERPLEHLPDVSDVCSTRWMLCRMGLPVELGMQIMEFAGYEPKRRLKIPHDPFHASNKEELAQYLKYCWQILVRCDMMAKVLDMKIDWEKQVAKCIIGLWDCQGYGRSYGKWWKQDYDEDSRSSVYVFLYGEELRATSLRPSSGVFF